MSGRSIAENPALLFHVLLARNIGQPRPLADERPARSRAARAAVTSVIRSPRPD